MKIHTVLYMKKMDLIQYTLKKVLEYNISLYHKSYRTREHTSI